MSIATTTAIAIGLGAAGAATSALGANAAGNAAEAQVDAAREGQTAQERASAAALEENRRQYDTTRADQAPFLQTGQDATRYLRDNAGDLTTPYGESFRAPTAEEAAANPGYKFAVDQGTQALASKAAAQGTLLSGNTGIALQQFGQNIGAQNYNDVFQRMLAEHTNAYNEYNLNQANRFNRYSSLAGGGQVAAQQLGSAGDASAGRAAQINLNTGANQAQLAQNIGQARGSGYINQANQWGNLMDIPGNVLSLQELLRQQPAASTQGVWV